MTYKEMNAPEPELIMADGAITITGMGPVPIPQMTKLLFKWIYLMLEQI